MPAVRAPLPADSAAAMRQQAFSRDVANLAFMWKSGDDSLRTLMLDTLTAMVRCDARRAMALLGGLFALDSAIEAEDHESLAGALMSRYVVEVDQREVMIPGTAPGQPLAGSAAAAGEPVDKGAGSPARTFGAAFDALADEATPIIVDELHRLTGESRN